MKFGIQVPRDVSEAEELDAANGNTLWHDAIEKEKRNVIIANSWRMMNLLLQYQRRFLTISYLMSNMI